MSAIANFCNPLPLLAGAIDDHFTVDIILYEKRNILYYIIRSTPTAEK